MKRKKTREEILMSHYASLGELGILLGKTSHEIGRALKALGLWKPNSGPTPKAIQSGYVWKRPYERCPFPLNTWVREKTVAALKAAGFPPKKINER